MQLIKTTYKLIEKNTTQQSQNENHNTFCDKKKIIGSIQKILLPISKFIFLLYKHIHNKGVSGKNKSNNCQDSEKHFHTPTQSSLLNLDWQVEQTHASSAFTSYNGAKSENRSFRQNHLHRHQTISKVPQTLKLYNPKLYHHLPARLNLCPVFVKANKKQVEIFKLHFFLT